MKKRNSPPIIKALNAVSVLALVVALICILVWGYAVTTVSIVFGSVCSLAAPAVVTGEGITEIFTVILEAFVEGCTALVDAVVSAISSIF